MMQRLQTGDRNHSRRGRFALPALLAALACLAVPSFAQAITVSGTAAPASLQAGAHSNVDIHIDFGGGPGASGQVKDLTVGLPPGLVADPTATPKCSVAQLNADACPANTVVGTVDATALVGVVPITASGNLFNMNPNPGEPARFGIVLHPLGIPALPPIILQSGAELRQTDFGLNSIILGISNTTLVAGDTTILSQDITLFGIAPGTGNTFARNPTSCTPKVTDFTAVDHAGGTGTGSTPPFTPTGCENLPFSPTFSAKTTAARNTQPVSITTAIGQTVAEAGLKDAFVQTPSDFAANLMQINNICPIPTFLASACPTNTIVGSATATAPYLTQPLTGTVALVTGAATPDIGLDLNGELHFLLRGALGLDNAVAFQNLPDIPISNFQLTFNGPPFNLLVANRDICGPPPPVFTERFVGHNGATTNVSTPAMIEGTCPPANTCPTGKKKKKKGKKSVAAAAKKKKHKKKSACARKKKKKKGKRK